jgi:DnaJ family protein C protein 2
MERQNAKIQAQAKREEAARVRSLVEQAMKKDPRIIAFREQEKAEKLAKKQAKEDAKRKKIEEEQRKKDEELRKEEERLAAENVIREQARKQKEGVKRLQKKIRRKLNAMTAEFPQINVRYCGIIRPLTFHSGGKHQSPDFFNPSG